MRYLSLFSGVGGFELGIQQAYENISKTKRTQQGRTARNSTDVKQSCMATKQLTCVGYSEFDPSCDKAKCKGYHTAINETQSKCGTCGKIKTQHAIQIYQKHFPNHKNYGDITKINEKELPNFDFLVGGFPCQSFSIAGKRRGFEDTRGTMFFEIARIIREKQPCLLLLENVKGLLSHDQGRTFDTIISTLDELGYDVQWQVLNSKNHGVPQNRERVFIIGHLRGTSRPEVFPFGGANEEDTRKVINPLKGKTKYGWHLEQNIYDKKGLTRTVKAGGGSGNMPKVLLNKKCKCNEGGECEVCCIGCGEYKVQCTCVEINQLNQPTHSNNRVYGTDGVSPTLNTMQGGNRQPLKFLKRNQKNVDGKHSFTVDTSNTGGVRIDNNIRRLTPTECERLQGFPDGWTEIGSKKCDTPTSCPPPTRAMCMGHDIEISDTQRYKTLGNAVTVNVIRDIVEKLL